MVSGGCVEAEVVAAALEVIKNGKTQMLNFAADDTGEWLSGLSCGGEMAVFVYPPLDNVIKTMREFIIARRIITITTNLQTGEQNIAESESEKETATIITNADGDGDRFIETLLPMRRLFIIGATHIEHFVIRQRRNNNLRHKPNAVAVTQQRNIGAHFLRRVNALCRRHIFGRSISNKTPRLPLPNAHHYWQCAKRARGIQS